MSGERKLPTLPCQVCGRSLAISRDGLVKRHKPPGCHGWDTDDCRGTGYRHARWAVGQRLQHHSSGVWVVVEDRGSTTTYGDYLIRCVEANTVFSADEQDREMIAHGEYMHRHGWTPIDDDCMCGCGFADHNHGRYGTAPCRYCDDAECSGYEPDLFVPAQPSSYDGGGE